MRISDWSSDVCSSDLVGVMPLREYARSASSEGLSYLRQRLKSGTAWDQFQGLPGVIAVAHDEDAREQTLDLMAAMRHVGDRKSVVQGQGVSVRVDLGGRRINKK